MRALVRARARVRGLGWEEERGRGRGECTGEGVGSGEGPAAGTMLYAGRKRYTSRRAPAVRGARPGVRGAGARLHATPTNPDVAVHESAYFCTVLPQSSTRLHKCTAALQARHRPARRKCRRCLVV